MHVFIGLSYPYMFPMIATKYRHSLPHVIGVTVSEYYEMIRLPVTLRTNSFSLFRPTSIPGDNRVSQVPDTSLTACHALRLRQALRNLAFYDFFVLASIAVKMSPPALISLTKLNCFGEARFPCGLQYSLCTLRVFRSHVCTFL